MNLKGICRLILIIATLFLFHGITASAFVEIENNNSMSSATPIPVNQKGSGNISAYQDVDYYRFTLNAQGTIQIIFNRDYVESSWTFWKLSVYQQNGDRIFDREYRGGNIAEYTSATVGLPAGTYYVKVESYNNWSDVSYYFTVQYNTQTLWETEFNDSFQTADFIETNKDYYGSLMEGNDCDYYRFNLSKNGKINILFNREYVDSNRELWKISLYNSEYVCLKSFSASGNDTVAYQTSSVGLPAGTYYVKIGSEYYSSTATYTLRVKASASNLWESEFNDSYSSADTIQLGKNVNGSIMMSDDKDVYKVKINKEQKVRIQFNRAYTSYVRHYWNVALYNSNYQKLTEINVYGGNTTTQYSGSISVTEGYCYIVVSEYFWSSVDYSLALTAVPDYANTFGHAESQITIGNISNKVYTGKRITPNPVVKKGSVRLKKGKDYTVTYSSNVYPGKAKVVVKGKGKYSGTVTTSFYIIPKKAQITSAKSTVKGTMTLKYKKQPRVSGYEIWYSRSKNGSYQRILTTTKTTVAFRGSSGTTYYFKVRAYKTIDNMRCYGSYSNVKKVRFR